MMVAAKTMEIYDVHFKSVAGDTIWLLFTLHNSDEEERPEGVIGTIMANNLNNAKCRLVKLLERQL